MKSRLFMSLLVALFMMSNVFAGTPLEDGLVLKGEFSQIGTRSLDPAIPIEATQNVYTSSIEVTACGQSLAIPVEDYNAGTYTIEFRNSKDGYVYGNFTLM